MRMTTYLKGIAAAGLTVLMLSGCTSGTTATGLGLGVGGSWSGTLYGSDGFKTNFTMQLAQSQASVDDPFAAATLTGVINTDKSCIGGGTISGTLDADNITITAATNSTLNMTGTATSNSMNGSWVIEQEAATATTTTTQGEQGTSTSTTTTETNNCFSTGGTWKAAR